MTLRDGGIGCVCHGTEPTISVNVWIEGPDSLIINQTAQYKLLMIGGPAVKGGFNVASYFGEVDSVDTLTRVSFGELTHSSPNPFSNDTVFWSFSYTAPDTLITDTLYSVGNSVNGDGNPGQLDDWNFGVNFVIQIIDNPVNNETVDLQPEDFVLYQNYPNPFNPSTNIGFRVADFPSGLRPAETSGFVSLKVYDILGNEVATLVSEEKQPGAYEVEFNTSSLPSRQAGIKNFPSSGIYLYQLKAGSFVDTKKMILLK
jgi:hypothetical protein